MMANEKTSPFCEAPIFPSELLRCSGAVHRSSETTTGRHVRSIGTNRLKRLIRGLRHCCYVAHDIHFLEKQ
ncbi:hypothetical protein DPMN_010454 [Dreissena polymorpha]|uniref:Uncharacterized protein n=1 Tax=Dreissena polymorpha TaxID=45954 RepID=A0A9D4N1J4_DREPO|nr:hypothetical protein DPMN_010454 [Dreissena polymorpha]